MEDSEAASNTPTSIINANRGSKNDEKDDFWIAYIIFAYQTGTAHDFDPAGEGVGLGVSPGFVCDCYMSSVCPRTTGTSVCSGIPTGALASLIYLEVSADTRRFWASPLPPYTTPKVYNEAETTVPHEVGHQLGAQGDGYSTLFKIMDYQDPSTTSGNVAVAFHPEHINIMRKRVHSPGN